MAKYSNPVFINRQAPEEVPLEPVEPQKTSGLEMAGNAAMGVTDAIQKFYAQRISDAEKKAKMDLMAANAQKAMNSSEIEKQRLETEKGKTSLENRKLGLEEKKQGLLENLFGDEGNDITNPVVAAKQDAEKAAAVDQMVNEKLPDTKPAKDSEAELKKYKKARAMGLIDENAYKRKEREVLITPQIEKFSDLFDNFTKMKGKPPATQEELVELADQASPDGKIFEEEFFKTKLKALPTRMDVDKQNFEKTKQEFAETKEETAGREKLGDNLKDYRAVIPVYNEVAKSLSNEKTRGRVSSSLNNFKALTRSLGYTDVPGGMASLINYGSEKTGLGSLRSSPDPRDREQLELLDKMSKMSPEERKKIIPPDVAKVFANISTLINKSLKKEAGSAVSAQEFERLMQQFGMTQFTDPENFFQSMVEFGKNLEKELEYVKQGANQKVVEKLSKKGLFDVTPINLGNKAAAPVVPPVAAPKTPGIPKTADDYMKMLDE